MPGIRNLLSVRLRDRLAFAGPALLLAVEASGEHGLTEVLAAGDEYGYALLWVFGITLLFKFALSHGIARYTLATGEPIFTGLRAIPGPKNWEVIFIMWIYILEMIGYGGIALFAGTFLAVLTGGAVPPLAITLAALAVIIAVLWRESLLRLEAVMTALVLVLVAGVAYSLLAIPLSPETVPVAEPFALIPHGSLMTIMALMGAVGSGLNLLLYSVWLHEAQGGSHGESHFRASMGNVTSTLAMAFLLIAFIAVVFCSLGNAANAGGEEHGTTIADITEDVSLVLLALPFGMPVFLLTGSAILFGAVISGMDGRARAIASFLQSTQSTDLDARTLYRIIILAFCAIILIAALIGSPEAIIRYISAFASIMFAVLGFMLIYVDLSLPPYARGSRLWLLVMASGSVAFLLIALLQEESILAFGLPLLERIALVVLALYLFSRSRLFSDAICGRTTWPDVCWIALIFGALSVYGTMRGIDAGGFIVNFRDLAPLIAGLVGGPAAGIASGFIGGAYRYTLGGWTVLPCSLAPVIAGLLGGAFRRLRRGKVTYIAGVLLAMAAECLHILVLVPLLTDASFPAYIGLIRTTLFPMMLANAVGVLMFLYILAEQGVSLPETAGDTKKGE